MTAWRNWRGGIISDQVYNACDLAAEDTAQAVRGQVFQEIPHDSGHLSQSVIVLPHRTLKGVRIISVGGGPGTGFPRVPYALRWHEENANFQKGRKSKYLKDPVNQVGPRALVNALRQRLSTIM